MHIPDGFIAPQMYLPAYAVAGGLWVVGATRLRSRLDDETIPMLATLTAATFVLMTIAVPLPGGTSVHAAGIAMLAVLFGIWASYLALSIVLLLQALLLGAGGVTALPWNALAMGFAGSVVAVAAFRALRRFSETAALFAAGWLAVNVAALILAVVLGLQPVIAQRPDGTPLYFPFGLAVTLPALLVPHAVVGIGEGVLTIMTYRFVTRWRRRRGG